MLPANLGLDPPNSSNFSIVHLPNFCVGIWKTHPSSATLTQTVLKRMRTRESAQPTVCDLWVVLQFGGYRSYISTHICIRKGTHTHTHLLRTIFANSDVERIVRAKTLQLHLTGMGRWKDPRKFEKLPSPWPVPNARVKSFPPDIDLKFISPSLVWKLFEKRP